MALAMLLSVCLMATQEPALPATRILPSATDRDCSVRLQMAGFSDNERAFAVTQHVRCRNPDQSFDRFDVVDLFALKTMGRLASYQASPITRSDARGKPLFARPQELARANPQWARALPALQWTKLKRGGHFALKKHDFKDVMVRLRRDPDSFIEVVAQDNRVTITNPKGGVLGFTGVGRLVDGSEVDLGHVREPKKGWRKGSLEVAFSAHGHVVAQLYHGRDADTLYVSRTPATQPIASTQVGFMQMLKWDADSVEELFGQMHPEAKPVWDEMVGEIE